MYPAGTSIRGRGGLHPRPFKRVRFRSRQISFAVSFLVFTCTICWAGEGLDGAFREYKGAIHVHSLYSDGKGTIEEIARAARRVGLDFVITTDHDTLAPLREGKEGWYDGVLVLVGSEITRGRGSYLAFNISRFPEGRNLVEETQKIRAEGGLSFIAHPYGYAQWWDWRHQDPANFTGMEIYDLGDDLLKESLLTRIRLFFAGLFDSEDVFRPYLDRPVEELGKWDELTLKRRVVGIAGSNVHARFRFFGKTIDAYWKLFKLVQNHVLVKGAFTGDPVHDKSLIYRALGQGHLYVAFGTWGDARGFRFRVTRGREKGIMGDEIPGKGPVRVLVESPQEAEWRLVRNGTLVFKREAKGLGYEIRSPGVYRVEAYRRVSGEKRLWILSNPIYLR